MSRTGRNLHVHICLQFTAAITIEFKAPLFLALQQELKKNKQNNIAKSANWKPTTPPIKKTFEPSRTLTKRILFFFFSNSADHC